MSDTSAWESSGVRKAYCSPPPEGRWGGEVSRTAGDLAGRDGGWGSWAGPAEGGWAAGDGDSGWGGWGHPESGIRRDGRREVGRRSAGGLDICIFICI